MARIKSKYIGIYYRVVKNRFCADGKPDKCFDIVYKKNGKAIFEKIGWRSEGYTIEDAVEIRGNRVRALRHPELKAHKTIPSQVVTIHDAWRVFEEKWISNLKHPKNVTGTYTRHIYPYFKNATIESLTPLAIEDFKQSLLQKQQVYSNDCLKTSTVKAILALLKVIINRSFVLGLAHGIKPAININIPNSDFRRERFLTKEEVDLLFEALQRVSGNVYTIARISLFTGMRLGEILKMQTQDVNIDARIIHVDGKTGKRVAYIAEELVDDLKKYIGENPTDLLFPSLHDKVMTTSHVSGKFSKIANALGLNNNVTDDSQRVVFHTLRHTFCSWLAMKGVPLFTIGELVGHTSVQTTQRYAKLSPDVKREALKCIHQTLISPRD